MIIILDAKVKNYILCSILRQMLWVWLSFLIQLKYRADGFEIFIRDGCYFFIYYSFDFWGF